MLKDLFLIRILSNMFLSKHNDQLPPFVICSSSDTFGLKKMNKLFFSSARLLSQGYILPFSAVCDAL